MSATLQQYQSFYTKTRFHPATRYVSRAVQTSDDIVVDTAYALLKGGTVVNNELQQGVGRAIEYVEEWEKVEEALTKAEEERANDEQLDTEEETVSMVAHAMSNFTAQLEQVEAEEREAEVSRQAETEDEDDDVEEYTDWNDLTKAFRPLEILSSHLEEAKRAIGTKYSLATWQANHTRVYRALQASTRVQKNLKKRVHSLKGHLSEINLKMTQFRTAQAAHQQELVERQQAIVELELQVLGLQQRLVSAVGPNVIHTFPALNSLLPKKQLYIQDLEPKHTQLYTYVAQPAPVGNDVVFVFGKVQEATTLWSKLKPCIKESLEIHTHIYRRQLTQNLGYEIYCTGDSYMLAFPSAEQAMAFCLSVQLRLLEAKWPGLLLATPECADFSDNGTILFKGLRVSMAVHCGMSYRVRDCRTLRNWYSGLAPTIGAEMLQLAQGGEILCTDIVHQRVSRLLKTLKGGAFCKQCNSIELPGISEKVHMFRVFPKAVGNRMATYPPVSGNIAAPEVDREKQEFLHTERYLLRNASKRAYERAPEGEICLVFTKVGAAAQLWDWDPEVMRQALLVHNAVMRKAADHYKGYEVQCVFDHFQWSFSDAIDATKFALHMQQKLLTIKWPDTLPDNPFTRTEIKQDRLIWSGLRVQMAIHVGVPFCTTNQATQRTVYFGQPVDACNSYLSYARGGEIVLSEEACQEVRHNLAILGEPFLRGRGTRLVRGSPRQLYQLLPRRLPGRSFPEEIHTDLDGNVHTWWYAREQRRLQDMKKQDESLWEDMQKRTKKEQNKDSSDEASYRTWNEVVEVVQGFLRNSSEVVQSMIEQSKHGSRTADPSLNLHVSFEDNNDDTSVTSQESFDAEEELKQTPTIIGKTILKCVQMPSKIQDISLKLDEVTEAGFDANDPYARYMRIPASPSVTTAGNNNAPKTPGASPQLPPRRFKPDYSEEALQQFVERSANIQLVSNIEQCRLWISELSLEFFRLHCFVQNFTILMEGYIKSVFSVPQAQRDGIGEEFVVAWIQLQRQITSRMGGAIYHDKKYHEEMAKQLLCTVTTQPQDLKEYHSWRKLSRSILGYLGRHFNVTRAVIRTLNKSGIIKLSKQKAGSPKRNRSPHSKKHKSSTDASLPRPNSFHTVVQERFKLLTGASFRIDSNPSIQSSSSGPSFPNHVQHEYGSDLERQASLLSTSPKRNSSVASTQIQQIINASKRNVTLLLPKPPQQGRYSLPKREKLTSHKRPNTAQESTAAAVEFTVTHHSNDPNSTEEITPEQPSEQPHRTRNVSLPSVGFR